MLCMVWCMPLHMSVSAAMRAGHAVQCVAAQSVHAVHGLVHGCGYGKPLCVGFLAVVPASLLCGAVDYGKQLGVRVCCSGPFD